MASGRPPTSKVAWVALAVAALWWAIVIRLAVAFVGDDSTLRLVAENSRGEAPWYYRLAALWGNAGGSLLLFAAVVSLVGVVGTWRAPARSVVAVVTSGGALGALALVVEWPFSRPAIPAIRGFGMTPILEHPAMAIHPPVLYLGLAATIVPFAHAVGGRRVERRWIAAAFSLIVGAMALGGWWSYAEQGWGGYWAWDPVENGSLVPWLALLAALHADIERRRGWAMAPWCLALAGAALARSGAVTSVHAFADAPTVGWGVAALAACCVVVAVASSVGRPHRLSGGEVDAHLSAPAGWLRYPRVLAVAAAVVVTIGVAAPLVARALPIRRITVGGEFFARLVLPLSIAALIAVAVATARLGRSMKVGAWLAHGGFVLVLLGALASTTGRHATAALTVGAPASVMSGLPVMAERVSVEPGVRAGSTAVVAALRVDGHAVKPALVSYPERGGVLAETVLVSRPWRDLQVVLLDADDDTAVVEVRTKPLVSVIWLGALGMALGGAMAAVDRRRGTASPVGVRSS